jgi:electron transport complex protein RnfC
VAAYKAGDVETLKKRQIDTCMDCGCCTFSCPANRPISEHLRLAKALARPRR